MSDTVLSAIIGVGGAVLVAMTSVVSQVFITRTIIRAERDRLAEEIHGEEASRAREKREERILDALSELLVASDPQSDAGVSYGKAANLIVRLQLLLDLNTQAERSLNGALNGLGLRLQEYFPVRSRSIDNKVMETKQLLQAHAEVLERAKTVLQRKAPTH